MSLIIKAAQFASQAHAGQVRKCTGKPYFQHPCRVAGRVAALPWATDVLVAAAYLHDVVEDCQASLASLESQFGFDVS